MGPGQLVPGHGLDVRVYCSSGVLLFQAGRSSSSYFVVLFDPFGRSFPMPITFRAVPYALPCRSAVQRSAAWCEPQSRRRPAPQQTDMCRAVPPSLCATLLPRHCRPQHSSHTFVRCAGALPRCCCCEQTCRCLWRQYIYGVYTIICYGYSSSEGHRGSQAGPEGRVLGCMPATCGAWPATRHMPWHAHPLAADHPRFAYTPGSDVIGSVLGRCSLRCQPCCGRRGRTIRSRQQEYRRQYSIPGVADVQVRRP